MTAQANYRVIPYDIICKATNGETAALNTVLGHYSNYIKKLCQRPIYDTYGNTALIIDRQLKQRIENSLINAILKFRL